MRNILTLGGFTLSVARASKKKYVKGDWFTKDLEAFKAKLKDNPDFKISTLHPILNEKFEDSGVAKGMYFYQDLQVAQLIYKANPIRHIDIGSRMDGFITHVASYRKIETIDIRPLVSKIDNVEFLQMDLMKDIDPKWENIADSLSCLHVIEHFGLGRYGDEIDPDGHLKGFKNMSKILKSKGKFYFSTPIGKQRIEFNAHRVFDVKYLNKMIADEFTVTDFYYVNDDGYLMHPDNFDDEKAIDNNFGCFHGCGIYVLTKK